MIDEALEVRFLEFANGHRSRAVFARGETDPCRLIEALALGSTPRAVVSVSGGARRLPCELTESVARLFRVIARPLIEQFNVALIDGGTASGVMKLLGEAVRATVPGRLTDGEPPSSLWPEPPLLIGFAPEPLVAYPGSNVDAPDMVSLDPNHPYHILIRDGRGWGDEGDAMFGVLFHLQDTHALPVVNLVINGGRATLMEAHRAARRGCPLVVMEGTGRTADLILSARDGRPPAELRKVMGETQVSTRTDDQDEALAWLDLTRQSRNQEG